MDLFALDKYIFCFFKQMSWQQGFEGLLGIYFGVYAWSEIISKKGKK